jgi:hypothetical protein
MPNTTGYRFGDLVLVPFPFTDQTGIKADGPVLELEDPSGTDVGAHAAADAGGALDVQVGHGVGADVDAHFAIGIRWGGGGQLSTSPRGPLSRVSPSV